MKIRKRIQKWYPLTFVGTVHFVVISSVWVYSFLYSIKPISIVSSTMFLFLLFLLFLTQRAKFSLSSTHFSWSFNSFEIALSSDLIKNPFLLHPLLEWRAILRSANKIMYHSMISFKFPESSEGTSRIPVPLSGILEIECTKVIQDIFGLTRAVLQTSENSIMPCIPLVSLQEPFLFSYTDNDKENQTIRSSAQNERIFVREYVAGDLDRDINWKAVSRTGSLITKIPPQSPQTVVCVTIALFPPVILDVKNIENPSLIALSYIRSLCYTLMNQISASISNSTIKIRCGDLEYCLLPDIAVADAANFLCSLSFSNGTSYCDPDPDCSSAWVIGSTQNPFFTNKIDLYHANGSHVIPLQKLSAELKPHISDVTLSLCSSMPFFVPSVELLKEIFSSSLLYNKGKNYVYEVTL